MPKRFTVTRQELGSVRNWIGKQIQGGRLPLSLSIIDQIRTENDAQRIIDSYLDAEARRRLQIALAVRRSRSTKSSQVTTSLDKDARDMLLKVAESRNLTTSDLIRTVFGEEFDRINS